MTAIHARVGCLDGYVNFCPEVGASYEVVTEMQGEYLLVGKNILDDDDVTILSLILLLLEVNGAVFVTEAVFAYPYLELLVAVRAVKHEDLPVHIV